MVLIIIFDLVTKFLPQVFTKFLLDSGFRDEGALLQFVAIATISSGLNVCLMLMFFRACYGRYSYFGIGSKSILCFGMNAKFAWFFQEIPAFLVSFIVIISDVMRRDHAGFTKITLASLFTFHYFQRSLIYPFLLRGGKTTPFILSFGAFWYTAVQGYVQPKDIILMGNYDNSVACNTRILIGLLIFFLGMGINLHSDHILRNLRKPGESGYKIPRGGMFNYVSGANFFGEIIEWIGFAIAAMTWNSISFAIFTVCNIGPRAYQHHRWYIEKFEDYPKTRKAIIPFIL